LYMDSDLNYELETHLAISLLALSILLFSAVLDEALPKVRVLMMIVSIMCSIVGCISFSRVLSNMVKRSLLKRFEKMNAFSPETAVTVDRLELDELVDPREFKQLVKQGIVKITADNRYYYPTEYREKRVITPAEKRQMIKTLSIVALITIYVIVAIIINVNPFIMALIFVIAMIFWRISEKLVKKNI